MSQEIKVEQANESSIILTKNLCPLFIQFTLPAVIAMVMNGVQGMVDGMFVGNVLGPNAMASVNLAIPFNQLTMGLSMIVSIGAQSHIGLKLGTNNIREAKDTFQTMFRMLIGIAGMITLLGLCFSRTIAEMVGANAVLLEETAKYIQVIACFSIPMSCVYYLGFLNRIVGKPEKYLQASLMSVIANVGLNYLFIVKLELGVRGAALATGIGVSLGLLMVVQPLLNREMVVNIYEGNFDRYCIKPVLYNGASEGINSLSIAVTIFLFNTTFMRLEGEQGVAAFTAINYIGNFGMLVLFGISDGIGPIISYNYGSGAMTRVKKTLASAYVVNFILGCVIFTILTFAGRQVTSFFVKNDPAIIEMAVSGGKLFALTFLLQGFNILNSGFFTFIGCGLQSVIVAASRGIVFVTIGIVILPILLGVSGVWLCTVFAEFCAAIIGMYLLRRLTNENNNTHA